MFYIWSNIDGDTNVFKTLKALYESGFAEQYSYDSWDMGIVEIGKLINVKTIKKSDLKNYKKYRGFVKIEKRGKISFSNVDNAINFYDNFDKITNKQLMENYGISKGAIKQIYVGKYLIYEDQEKANDKLYAIMKKQKK